VKEIATRLPTIRVFALEWSDPPFAGGHWVPEMIEAVGGVNLLGAKGEPSREVTWREIGDATPEVIVITPCGYYLEEAEEEATGLFAQPDFAGTPAAREGNVFAVDATSFFSRPGPRIADGLEILAWAVHPEAYPEPPRGGIARVAG
jgi:iron complex transport system substrate-binding protein